MVFVKSFVLMLVRLSDVMLGEGLCLTTSLTKTSVATCVVRTKCSELLLYRYNQPTASIQLQLVTVFDSGGT